MSSEKKKNLASHLIVAYSEAAGGKPHTQSFPTAFRTSFVNMGEQPNTLRHLREVFNMKKKVKNRERVLNSNIKMRRFCIQNSENKKEENSENKKEPLEIS